MRIFAEDVRFLDYCDKHSLTITTKEKAIKALELGHKIYLCYIRDNFLMVHEVKSDEISPELAFEDVSDSVYKVADNYIILKDKAIETNSYKLLLDNSHCYHSMLYR